MSTRRPRNPRGPGRLRRSFYWVLWAVGWPLCALYFRVRSQGKPRPFPPGPLVLAANHCSYLDPVVLAHQIPRRIVFLVRSDVYDVPWMRPLLWALGCIPVEVNGSSLGAIRAAIAELRRGTVVGIFPEGGISDDGRLQRGQPGVGALLVKGKARIYPVALCGTERAYGRHCRVPKPAPIRLVWGHPIDPELHEEEVSSSLARDRITQSVMDEISRLLPAKQQPLATLDPVGESS